MIFTILLQTFLSVTEDWMIVTRMQLASTLLGVTTACATLGSLEMDSHALVSSSSKHWFSNASCVMAASTAL